LRRIAEKRRLFGTPILPAFDAGEVSASYMLVARLA
jgi:hypothetical protein